MKLILMKYLSICFCMVIWGYGLAASSGEIRGYVIDAESGEDLVGANVYIENTHLGTATGRQGDFLMDKVPAGKYLVVVSMLGYETAGIPVTVSAGRSLKLNVKLKSRAFNLGNVVVTATRSNELVTSVPMATEVLGPVQLKESNADNVGQALQSVGASLLKSYGPVGSLSTLSLRGSADTQILVLVDGQRLNDSQSGSVDLSLIPLEAVEKIEVVKGGHSALYGSDAVGGVINIITEDKARDSGMDASASTTYGSFNTRIFDASMGQGLGNWNYFLSYNHTQTGGNYEYLDDAKQVRKMVNADNEADDIFAKLGYVFPNQSRLSIYHQYHHAREGSPGPIQFPNASARRNITRNHTSVSYHGFSVGPVALNFQGYLMRTGQQYIDPESYTPEYLPALENDHYENNAFGLSIQGYSDLQSGGLLSYGYDFRQDDMKADKRLNGEIQPFLGNHQRHVHGFFLQDEWKHALSPHLKFTLVPAIRLDRYPDKQSGTQLTPKIGFTLNRTSDWLGTIRGNVGRVFRVPTFNDLYWPEDSWTVGNPDLKPEEGYSYDGGFITQFQRFGYWSVEGTYFASRLQNLIIWTLGESGKYMPQNVSEALTRGIESKISWSSFRNVLNAQFGCTFMKSTDRSSNPLTRGKYLVYRPKNKFDAGLGVHASFAAFNLFYHYVGERYNDDMNTAKLDSYSLVNLNIAINPALAGLKWTVRFEVNNLMDKNIQVIQGYPIPGREYRVTVGMDGSFLK
ncbi:MAG: TonB-dependent receptor [Calditrichia bacterium]